MSRAIAKLMIIALSAGMLCGCRTSETIETLQNMYESATSSKEEEMSVEVFSSEIVKDLMEKR